MTFKYKRIAPGLLRPIIPILLQAKSDPIKVEVLVDSGADICIFDTQIGELLGLNVKKGKIGSVTGVTGAEEQTYSHNIILDVGGNRLSINAVFKDNMPQEYGNVGQVGFFNYFVVVFDYRKERVELVPKPEIN